MKGGCLTSGIQLDQTIELSNRKTRYPSRKGKKDPGGDTGIQGYHFTTAHTGLVFGFKGWGAHLVSGLGCHHPAPQGQAQPHGAVLPHQAQGGGTPLNFVGWEGRVLNQAGLFTSLRISWNLLARFCTCFGPVIPFSLQISPFWNENINPMPLAHHCILEALNLSGFTGSQLEKNFASG